MAGKDMFTLKEIVDITGGEPVFFKDGLKIKGISTDSRTIKKGELFVALKGERFDGCGFIDQARRKGAAGAVVPEGIKAMPGFLLVRVKDTTKALGSIARAHRKKFDIPVIAVTGSNGKTTTKDMIAHILNEKFKVLKTDKNENNRIGIARTLLRLKSQDLAVVEVGTSCRGEIKYHSSVLRPNIAIITNIGPSHLKGLRDAGGVLREKIALAASLGRGGVWIKNADDQLLSSENLKGVKVLTYGINREKVDFRAWGIRQTKSGITFRLKTLSEPRAPHSNNVFAIPLLGIHNVYNALAAIAACSVFMDLDIIRKALSDFKGPKMRTQILNTDGFTIINDCYNSNPLSFRYAVSVLKEYPASGRRIAVCADMLDLGRGSNRLHYKSGEFLADEGIDLLITYGEKSRHIAEGAIDKGMDKERVAVFRDKDKVVSFLRSLIGKGDIILMKGSRGMRMEEVIEGIR